MLTHIELVKTERIRPAGESHLFAGGEIESDQRGGSDADDDEEEDEGAADAKELAAETQRVLRGAALPLEGSVVHC